MISIFMPCRISVFARGGETVIAALRPAGIREFFPEADLGGIPEEVDALVRAMVDEAR